MADDVGLGHAPAPLHLAHEVGHYGRGFAGHLDAARRAGDIGAPALAIHVVAALSEELDRLWFRPVWRGQGSVDYDDGPLVCRRSPISHGYRGGVNC